MKVSALVILLIMVAAVAAFLLGLFYVVAHLFRGVNSAVKNETAHIRPPRRRGSIPQRICSNEKCRKTERRDARYCSLCGSPMGTKKRGAKVKTGMKRSTART
ncbi:MAG: hypothetical protein ACYTHJ_01170 [Planctomycetota bacterium]|jgi:hypothetical protein